ncbi:MAG TPA: antitoxin family protein [Thermoanaerobaculia bacterium]|nr:antitoxin family protein [Thermoanaerobaculia bacterium]
MRRNRVKKPIGVARVGDACRLAVFALHRRPIGRSVLSMTQTIEAIYTDGVLKPTAELPLRDNQRVRLIVETIDETSMDREAAVSRLKSGIASMRFFLEGPLPSREELHDRR